MIILDNYGPVYYTVIGEQAYVRCNTSSNIILKIKNINWPRTVPWGTPDNTGCEDEDLPSMMTL